MKPFDEAAGHLLDSLLEAHRIKGRHYTACCLSMALCEAASGAGPGLRDALELARLERDEARDALASLREQVLSLERVGSDGFSTDYVRISDVLNLVYATAESVIHEVCIATQNHGDAVGNAVPRVGDRDERPKRGLGIE